MNYAVLIVFGGYLLATLFYLLRLITGHKKFAAIGLRVTTLAAMMQVVVLTRHVLTLPPITYHEYYQLTALILAVVFVILCFTKRFYGSGPIFIVFIDLFYLLSLWNHQIIMPLSPRGASYLLVHLITIFMSLSVFTLTLVTALMFLLSEYQIKNKRFEGIITKFPSLSSLDEINYKSLYAGFVLFTLTIITGAGYSKVNVGHYLSGDVKQVLSVVVWVMFALFMNLRARQGWQGHRGIVLSLVGLGTMAILFAVGLK